MPSDPALEAKFEAWKKRNAIDYSPLYRCSGCPWCSFKRAMFRRKLRKDANLVADGIIAANRKFGSWDQYYKRPQ